jgi:hypothetical protein
MRKLARWKIRNFLAAIFIAIPISALLALLVWFVGHVLLGYPLAYTIAWKWCFIAGAGFTVFTDLIIGIPAVMIICRRLTKQYQASVDDVADAIVRFGLLKEEERGEWGPEEFRKWLFIARTATSVTDAVMGKRGQG